MVRSRYLEASKDGEEYEEIIQTKALFDQVAGQKRLGGFAAKGVPDKSVKEQTGAYPDAAPNDGSPASAFRVASVGNQIKDKQHRDDSAKSDPCPYRNFTHRAPLNSSGAGLINPEAEAA